ncbi:MAG: D-alanine--D-alanine ligase [Deltaproteobacteria bacterium]|nr:D-alanine--D-alanine ligase [Deltaproteobacteria bacterium]
MIVGMTYDLRDDYLAEGYSEEETAEFDRAETIDAIEKALRALGYETDRIGHFKALVTKIAAGRRWDIVFNIAEGLNGIGREAQVPALLDAYGIPYVFSDPLVLALTLDKAVTKRVVRDLGIPTPPFVVITGDSDIGECNLPYPLFVKPLAEGTGKGIDRQSRIHNQGELQSMAAELLRRFRQPVLVETYLPGREFTAGIVGTGRKARILGVMEVLLNDKAEPGVYSYVNKEHCEELVEYRIVDDETAIEAGRVALAAWRGLGCRDAGRVDIRADAAGVPNFMEVNPLAGLHPLHSDLPIIAGLVGVSFTSLIESIMHSAISRLDGCNS